MTATRDAVPTGIILSVMGVVAVVLSDLPSIYTHGSGFGDGEGQGDLGAMKLYLSSIVQGTFLTLGLVLLAGAATCFLLALVRRRRA
ncbi:hypothetical protein [Nocardioides sp. W7]|uniref:hypothetical protein n=1 Tax=Nocardioides sp. W7 TaxID=2931390 RepID=UPI001FD21B79|nr:hypothetical protein [Nocardioides sp. W7]